MRIRLPDWDCNTLVLVASLRACWAQIWGFGNVRCLTSAETVAEGRTVLWSVLSPRNMRLSTVIVQLQECVMCELHRSVLSRGGTCLKAPMEIVNSQISVSQRVLAGMLNGKMKWIRRLFGYEQH